MSVESLTIPIIEDLSYQSWPPVEQLRAAELVAFPQHTKLNNIEAAVYIQQRKMLSMSVVFGPSSY